MKLKAIANYDWWTVGKKYDVVHIDDETNKGSTWYRIIDDKNEAFDLNDEINSGEFEIINE